jgi:hypothetical protein
MSKHIFATLARNPPVRGNGGFAAEKAHLRRLWAAMPNQEAPMNQPTRIWRRAERVFTPWKNGGGRTAEILAMPEGAGLDGFDSRISTAEVAQSGPFSLFAGIDRWLTVLEGGAMTLSLPERDVEIAPGAAPVAFPGDVPCAARLHGPALLDLNVMVRRPLRAHLGAPSSGPVLARYALALQPVPEYGLQRFDLIACAPAQDPRLLWIEILPPA